MGTCILTLKHRLNSVEMDQSMNIIYSTLSPSCVCAQILNSPTQTEEMEKSLVMIVGYFHYEKKRKLTLVMPSNQFKQPIEPKKMISGLLNKMGEMVTKCTRFIVSIWVCVEVVR